eukprot:335005-Prorocentrum_minimum.AAC.1
MQLISEWVAGMRVQILNNVADILEGCGCGSPDSWQDHWGDRHGQHRPVRHQNIQRVRRQVNICLDPL